MTVIAWDGNTIAADRMGTRAGLKYTARKLHPGRSGEWVAFAGSENAAIAMRAWYDGGLDPEAFPECQKTEEWARMVVASASGLVIYELSATPIQVIDPFMAFGAGCDFAMGAMATGATAVQAVEIANKWCEGCGLGVDSARVR